MGLEHGALFEDKYEILGVVAEGGMSSVYAARDATTGDTVALKVLSVGSDNRLAARRFQLEVSAASKVRHPGVVQVLDAGTDSRGRFFLTMELLSGVDLAKLLDDPVVSTLQLLDYLLQAIEVVAAAHACGVVHRDIKPENLFVERRSGGARRVRLLDFGVARDLGQVRNTATGATIGTALYMAPEQAVDQPAICQASDVWAFGVILYEVLTGVLPFQGASPHAVIVDAVTKPHAPLGSLRPDVPASLASLVDRCLSKEPGDRPPDAAALHRELADCVAQLRAVPRAPRGVPRGRDSLTFSMERTRQERPDGPEEVATDPSEEAEVEADVEAEVEANGISREAARDASNATPSRRPEAPVPARLAAPLLAAVLIATVIATAVIVLGDLSW